MPLIRIQSSVKEIKNEDKFLEEISKELANQTNKPEKYVMTILEINQKMLFGCSSGECCFVEIKSIGNLDPKTLSNSVCTLISKYTKVPTERIYIEFKDVNASNWGFNCSTF